MEQTAIASKSQKVDGRLPDCAREVDSEVGMKENTE